ncbi:hypothetical protein [Micromonospora sp. LOL_023]|uniref:hypothetical protein n=1 Tax=Micromonospora sp. LOL_023 TaxID=3345418 RepID=UPI003A85E99C
MSEPDFDRMSKDEVITWFQATDSLAPVIRSMTTVPATGAAPEAPMMLVSIRLPVALVEQPDSIVGESATRRSDVIRDVLTGYVASRTVPVGQHEAERALEVLRRIVTAYTGEGHADAA